MRARMAKSRCAPLYSTGSNDVIQRMLRDVSKLIQYCQGIGRANGDEVALKRLNPDRQLIVFDVGANRGQYLERVLTYKAAEIHAFEPSSAAFAELQRRFGGRSNIILNNVALGDVQGRQTLHFDHAGSELSSLYRRHLAHHDIQFAGTEEVEVVTIDDYCASRGIERIDLLKLDVEGHELNVLHGAMKMFERSAIGMVSFEFGGCNIDSRTFVRDFFHFFEGHKLKLGRVTPSGRVHFVERYEEALEQFRITCFVAVKTSERSP